MLTDWFGPLGHGAAEAGDLMEENHRQDAAADALILGRRTFQDFRGCWPQRTDDTTGITDYLNRVHKYVVSSTLTEPAWENSTIISSDPIEHVRALQQQDGLDIVVTGSITLTHALIRARLVDEYRLFVYHSVQGRGRRLFPDGHEIPLLRLTDSKAFRSGVTLQRYASASPTTPGPL
ncbi:dihydrofolate reductase family protein [Kocuria sediminis]|uniref:dihydrofolate reductase family protein n=1 Tax=Kocuria sediminis TaxID=1038857 RepID=UPI001F0D4FC5|nr:dihydrofolate reductase family protein [Kocuria sediminis]